MSSLAAWLLVALAFVGAVALVVLTAWSVVRKGRRLIAELDGLRLDAPTLSTSEYSGYHRRVSSRQEEVDHG